MKLMKKNSSNIVHLVEIVKYFSEVLEVGAEESGDDPVFTLKFACGTKANNYNAKILTPVDGIIPEVTCKSCLKMIKEGNAPTETEEITVVGY